MSCNFCERKGLALLPVRPAIVKVANNIPFLPDEITMDISDNEKITYTCRQLRDGYLYVYDEKRQRWVDYIVTEEGYFWKINHNTPSIMPQSGKPCLGKADEVAKSSFITLPLAKNSADNGVFWFGWSDYAWTNQVRKQHADKAYRAKHMQQFDLKAWLTTKKSAQAVSFDRLSQVVAEYATYKPAEHQMRFRSAKWQPKSESETTALLNEAKKLSVVLPGKANLAKAIILAIPDPTGIVRDLAELISRASSEFVAQCQNNSNIPDFNRKMSLNLMIEAMKHNVKEKSMLDNFKSAEEQELRYRSGQQFGIFSLLTPSLNKDAADSYHKGINENLNEWADEEWRRYQRYYNEAQREGYLSTVKGERDKYVSSYVRPLSEMYLGYLKSTKFKRYFICNFDTQDIHGGKHYSLLVAACLLGGQEEGMCFDYFHTLLQGDVADVNNPIMRAYVFNQDKLAEIFKKHMPDQLVANNLSTMPWYTIFSTYSAYLNEIGGSKGAINTLTPLNSVLTGALMSVLSRITSKEKIVGQLPVLLSIYTESPAIYFEKSGTRKALSRALTEKIVQETFNAAGLNPAKRLMAKQQYKNQVEARVKAEQNTSLSVLDMVEMEMRHKEIAGIKLDGKGTQGYLLLLSDDVHPNLTGKTPQQKLDYIDDLLSKIKTDDQVYDFYLKKRVAGAALGGSFISLLFQSVAIYSMIKTEEKWYGGIHGESAGRLTASWIGVVGGAMELAAGSVAFMTIRSSSMTKFWSLFEAIGKEVGIFAGIVLACLDFARSYEEYQKGNTTLSGLYLFSGLAGIGFVAAMIFGWTIFGLILVPIFITIAYFINYYSPNDLMKWLERTLWGVARSGKFTDKQEREEYSKLWNAGS